MKYLNTLHGQNAHFLMLQKTVYIQITLNSGNISRFSKKCTHFQLAVVLPFALYTYMMCTAKTLYLLEQELSDT
jgi:hypothetical protein